MSTQNVTVDLNGTHKNQVRYTRLSYPSGLVYIFATDKGQIRLLTKSQKTAVSSTHTKVTAHHTKLPSTLLYDSFLLTSSNLFLLAPNFLLMILRVKVKSGSFGQMNLYLYLNLRRATIAIVVYLREKHG